MKKQRFTDITSTMFLLALLASCNGSKSGGGPTAPVNPTTNDQSKQDQQAVESNNLISTSYYESPSQKMVGTFYTYRILKESNNAPSVPKESCIDAKINFETLEKADVTSYTKVDTYKNRDEVKVYHVMNSYSDDGVMGEEIGCYDSVVVNNKSSYIEGLNDYLFRVSRFKLFVRNTYKDLAKSVATLKELGFTIRLSAFFNLYYSSNSSSIETFNQILTKTYKPKAVDLESIKLLKYENLFSNFSTDAINAQVSETIFENYFSDNEEDQKMMESVKSLYRKNWSSNISKYVEKSLERKGIDYEEVFVDFDADINGIDFLTYRYVIDKDGKLAFEVNTDDEYYTDSQIEGFLKEIGNDKKLRAKVMKEVKEQIIDTKDHIFFELGWKDRYEIYSPALKVMYQYFKNL